MTRRDRVARKGRMLVTGANGLLGTEICRAFSPGYEIRATDIAECDVTRREECMRHVGRFLPDVVLHCAAYTSVDRAEREEGIAFDINARGTRNMALACREHRALLVTFGTDYVFDGKAKRPYREEDPVRPLSAYGRSKLAAERALEEIHPDFLLLRTQWLFGAQGRNFALSILARAEKGEKLEVVRDQRGSPTYTRDLAGAVARLLDTGARGIFHFSNGGETTFFDYAAFLLARAGMDGARLSPIASSDLPREVYPAPRPAFAVLSKEKYRRATGALPRRWEDAVTEFVQNRKRGGGNG